MRRNLEFVYIGIFALAVLVSIVVYNGNKPRVLILHSGDAADHETRSADRGINQVIGKRSNYYFRRYYMNTRRHPSAAYKAKTGIAVRRVVEDWKPHVIIAIGGDAQEYGAVYFLDHPAIRIVFAGLDAAPETYGYDKGQNVTGIVETNPFQGIRKALLDAEAEKGSPAFSARVVQLGDASASATESGRSFRSFDWSPLRRGDALVAETFEEWKRAVHSAAKQGDYLVLSAFRSLKRSAADPTQVDAGEVAEWTERNSRIPVIGTHGDFVENGGMMAISASPYEQGEVAAGIAVGLIDQSRTLSGVPAETGQHFAVSMRKARMQARNFVLPAIYESFARGTDNFFE